VRYLEKYRHFIVKSGLFPRRDWAEFQNIACYRFQIFTNQATLTTTVRLTSHSALNIWPILISHTSCESSLNSQSLYVRILLDLRICFWLVGLLWYSSTYFQNVYVQHVLGRIGTQKMFLCRQNIELKNSVSDFVSDIWWYVEKMPKTRFSTFK